MGSEAVIARIAGSVASRCGLYVVVFLSLEAVFRPPETLRPLSGQAIAVLVKIDQGEGRAKPLVVLP
jgi:hypothetical protein